MFSSSDAYERFMGRWSRRLAPHFVTFAGVREGEQILDVGTGTGALARAIAAATTTTRVVGIDPAARYVAAAAAQDDDPRLRFEVGDAMNLPFADGRFDRALSMLVLNFVPEPATALRQMCRVTRPGGVVAAAVWDYGAGMEMLRLFWDEVVTLDPAAAPLDERHLPLCAPGELEALWRQEALEQIEAVALELPLPFASFDDYWAPFLEGQGPGGHYVATLSDGQRAALADRVRQRLLPDGEDGAVTLQGRAWAVRGTVPER